MDVHGRDLRYFLAAADQLNFTRAAESLHVSQPALSKQIRMLERALATPLFDREVGGVQLTNAGRALLPYARRLLAEWERAEATVERIVDTERSTLVVGMSTSPARGGLLSAIRSRFNDRHPNATLTLRQIGWADPTAGLADGTTDVAFIWLPVPNPARYRWFVLLHETPLVALPERHHLASRSEIDFKELLHEPFLALPKSAGPLRDHWLGMPARDGKPPMIGAEITSADETYEALVDGRGICLLAAGNAPSIAREGVTTRPVTGLPLCQLAVAWRKDREKPHALARAYCECAREVTTLPSRAHSESHLGVTAVDRA